MMRFMLPLLFFALSAPAWAQTSLSRARHEREWDVKAKKWNNTFCPRCGGTASTCGS